MRVHGHLSPLPGFGVMTPADTKRLAYSVLTDAQKHRFEENLELDFSFGLKGMSRFRANLFNQKGAVGAVFRAIPYEIKTFNDLGLRQSSQIFKKPPLDPCHRPTGSGKSTTLASMGDISLRTARTILRSIPFEFRTTTRMLLDHVRWPPNHRSLCPHDRSSSGP